jgi:hypothetical protein
MSIYTYMFIEWCVAFVGGVSGVLVAASWVRRRAARAGDRGRSEPVTVRSYKAGQPFETGVTRD